MHHLLKHINQDKSSFLSFIYVWSVNVFARLCNCASLSVLLLLQYAISTEITWPGWIREYLWCAPLSFEQYIIRFDSKLYRKIVDIPMSTNWALFAADFFLFWYFGDFTLSLSDNNQVDVIWVFNSTWRYLDDLLKIYSPYFEQMVGQTYPAHLT